MNVAFLQNFAAKLKEPVEGVGPAALAAAVGLLLLASGTLKLHADATASTPTAFLDVPLLTLEFSLGLALLVFPRQKLLWIAAMGLFGIFAIVASSKAAAGSRSCGCFGRVEVPPQYTLAIDLWVLGWLGVGLFLAGRPSGAPTILSRSCLLAATATIGGVLWVAGHSSASGASLRDRLSDVVAAVDRPERLHGRRLIVFLRRGCPHCRRLEAALANGRVKDPWASMPVALIELQPTDRLAEQKPSREPESRGAADERTAWYLHATDEEFPFPIVAEAVDGRIVAILSEADVTR